MNITKYITDNPDVSYKDGSKHCGISVDAYRKRYRRIHPPKKINKQSKPLDSKSQADLDIRIDREKKKQEITDQKYKLVADRLEKAERELNALRQIGEVVTTKIPKSITDTTEATAVVVASDWHSEELVDPDTIDDLNEFNLDIFEERSIKFFQNVVKLLNSAKKSNSIKTLVLALLGDFISGSIHDELAEENQLNPADALINAQNKLASGIEYILANSDVNLIIPCHSGNHGRMTEKQRIANESGNSLEFYMYHQLANHFHRNPRVSFRIGKGYHSYLDVAGYLIRFHHGHAIRFAGGVGGITIPVNKAIAQWDKGRTANLDVFGHFHQQFDGGKFICNGSLIGYNAYALKIKAEFQKPKQIFFIINHAQKEKTHVCPVWLT